MTFLPPEWKRLRAAEPRLELQDDLPLLLLSAAALPAIRQSNAISGYFRFVQTCFCLPRQHCCARRGQMKQMLQFVENCGTVNTRRCTNGRRLALPGREVMSMVTYGELFAYTLVLIGVATLVFQMCKRK